MKRPKTKKYCLTLTEREVVRLGRYAEENGVSRPQALQRLFKQALREATGSGQRAPGSDANQLGLFDTLQIDIFNNTAVVNNKE